MEAARGMFEPIPTETPLLPGIQSTPERVELGKMLYFEPPCGQCFACLDGHQAQCGGSSPHWAARTFGNMIDGCQAEYVRVPLAMANLTPVPDGFTDEQVLMCPDHHEHRVRRH
jgi:threonine dehydrogenase-like Zn-dependent dehydrogenase